MHIDDLATDNKLLKLILDNCFGNIFVTNGSGRIIYVNDHAVRALNVSRELLLQMSIYDLVEKGVSDKASTITALETKQESIQLVNIPGGSMVVNSTPVFGDSGEIEYVVSFSQNRTVVEHFIRIVQQENQAVRQTLNYVLHNNWTDSALVAESHATKECLHVASRAAGLDSSIMLYGESGTGKEVFARFIHRHSQRAQQVFLPVNCAAIPQELMESEFFGYDKGAFTGANREGKLGLFELASGGVLFLDEIGELTLPLQSKLLRVLETGEVKRVGSTIIKTVDVRIIAATNRDLRLMMEDGTFREDLYYRLNVIPITIPPLRKRHEDITVLATQFLCQLNKKYSTHKLFSGPALAALQNYDWPGNIRELRNVVERVFVIIPEDMITEQHIRDILGVSHTVAASAGEEMALSEDFWGSSLQTATERFQRAYLTRVLRSCGGNIRAAARYAGIGRSGLYKKLDRMGMMEKSHWIDPDKSS
ncbi:sigma-54 interaction domain-containing protein [Intestinimonas butyriciproducens]|uniref:sigma-54 interaction domain-containing protein n=1 Tax=Intestinimonas butyriciproducens TaxID=1297617 RepID=UPI000690F456|nr:sigma-54-dependent Fis family transcriptional regulator [Intestinimonas butyriciproducens]